MLYVSERAVPQLIGEGIIIEGALLAALLFYLTERNTHQNWQIEGVAIDPLQIFLSDLVPVVGTLPFYQSFAERKTDLPLVGALSRF